MIFDIVLIVLAILSLAYIIRLVVKKFSRLTNVNVDNLPDIQIQRQKDAILTKRLERSWSNVLGKSKELAGPWQKKLVKGIKDYYQQLKNLETDLRRRGHQELSSNVDKSKAINELVTKAGELLKNEEYQLAEEVLLDALSYDQHSVDAYKVLAEVYRCKKEYEQAKQTLEYLLRLTHNEDSAVYSSLGKLARQRGDLKQAEEDYLKSISLADDNHLHFLSLAETYLELEEESKALATARRALVLSPNSPKVLDFLINVSIIMQDKELALRYLDKLKEVNPDNQKILEFLEYIDKLK